MTLAASRIEASARAGLSSFGAAVDIGATSFECSPIALDGEEQLGVPFALQDLGENDCGCSGAAATCKVLSSALQPPKRLPEL